MKYDTGAPRGIGFLWINQTPRSITSDMIALPATCIKGDNSTFGKTNNGTDPRFGLPENEFRVFFDIRNDVLFYLH